jgi:hypothetical protein
MRTRSGVRPLALACAAAAAAAAACGCGSDPEPLRFEIAFEPRSLGARAAAIEARIVKGGCVSDELMYVSIFAPDGAGTPPPQLPPGHYGFVARAQDSNCYWYAQGCAEVELPRDGKAVTVQLAYLAAETLDCDGPTCSSVECSPPDAGSDADTPVDEMDGGATDAGVNPDDDAGVEIDGSAPLPPVLITVEAEQADPLLWPLASLDDENALGSQFISYPWDPDQSLDDRQALKRATPPADDAADGLAVYQFEVPRTGIYRMWGRVITPTLDEDSFWVRIDDRDWIQWNDIAHLETWHWVDVRPYEERTDRYPIPLDAGQHTLRISYRELGAKLDQMLFASDMDFVPRL